MKCIGLLSIAEPESSALYWRRYLEEVRTRTNGRHSGHLVAESLDVAAFEATPGRGPAFVHQRRLIADAARRLEGRGAQAVLLGSSPLHLHAKAVRAAMNVPLLHVATATAEKLQRLQLVAAALLGLDPDSGEPAMWRSAMAETGIRETIIPQSLAAAFVQERLERGLNPATATDEIRAAFTRLSVDLKQAGARIIVLTRPELAFGLTEEDSVIPTLCAVRAHCAQAARFALEDPDGPAAPTAGQP